MNTIPKIKETIFSIDGDHYTIRPVEPSDLAVDLEQCDSVRNFWNDQILLGQNLCSSEVDMQGIYNFTNQNAIGFVACRTFSTDKNPEPVEGLALMARNTNLGSHQFTLSVKSTHRFNRLPNELLNMLINYRLQSEAR